MKDSNLRYKEHHASTSQVSTIRSIRRGSHPIVHKNHPRLDLPHKMENTIFSGFVLPNSSKMVFCHPKA